EAQLARYGVAAGKMVEEVPWIDVRRDEPGLPASTDILQVSEFPACNHLGMKLDPDVAARIFVEGSLQHVEEVEVAGERAGNRVVTPRLVDHEDIVAGLAAREGVGEVRIEVVVL